MHLVKGNGQMKLPPSSAGDKAEYLENSKEISNTTTKNYWK